MVFRAMKKGLAGILLGTTMSLSSCVNPYQNMSEEQNQGLMTGLLGAALSAQGVQKGNTQAVLTGDALTRIGAAQAGASRNTTNIHVNNGGNNNYQNNSQRYCRPFIGERHEDFNRDGCFDIKTELVGRGKTIFGVNEELIVGIEQRGYRGSNLRFVAFPKKEGVHYEINSIKILKDGSLPHLPFKVPDFPTEFELYITLDGQKIGSFDIVVK